MNSRILQQQNNKINPDANGYKIAVPRSSHALFDPRFFLCPALHLALLSFDDTVQ
jgi:hypothetical protein